MLASRLQRVFAVATSLMVALASASAQSPPFTYLFDLLKQPTFHRSFDELFEGQPNVDDWIRVFQKTKDGVASPIEQRQIGQTAYILAEVCKPHDCGNNMLRVLFTKDGTQATAVLITLRGQRWFATPNAAEKAQLLK
jgi:Inhibitor of vertebrate lysozyme (Ivy)